MARSTIGGHSSSGSRRSRTSRHASSTRRHTIENKAVKSDVPDVDEVRRMREAYFGQPVNIRIRPSSTSLDKPSSKPRSSQSTRPSTKSSTKSSTRSKSSGSRAKKPLNRTEEYVYGTAAPVEVILEEEQRSQSEHARREERRSSRKHKEEKTALSILDEEVTPEDSVSQIGTRSHRRRAAKRSSLAPVLENSDALKVHPEPKRTSLSLGSIFRRSSVSVAPPRLVECLTCASEVSSAKAAKLECSHYMCHSCLKRIFKLSVQDPAHMPPKCCTDQHIPLKHVDNLFDLKFKLLFNKKFDEYKTKDRVYCPNSKCGAWIRPAYFHTSGGRRYAQCNRCRTKACISCGMRMHKSKECPEDPEIKKLVEQAEKEGWKRCYQCNAMVELKEGCNHMTCRCTAEFCMVCGLKWKTCDCPWFNNVHIADADRLLDMRVPDPLQFLYRHVPAIPQIRAEPVPPPRTYREEMAQRRRQEHDDENLAQRMQWATLLDREDPRIVRHQDTWGVGNNASHHMNDNHVLQDPGVSMTGFGDANMGKRGERASGRRRTARHSARADTGLVPNFLGEPSVLGAGRS